MFRSRATPLVKQFAGVSAYDMFIPKSISLTQTVVCPLQAQRQVISKRAYATPASGGGGGSA